MLAEQSSAWYQFRLLVLLSLYFTTSMLCFSLSGYPLTHLDDYKAELSKFHNCAIPDSTHMAKLIPVLKNQVENEWRAQFASKRIAVVFDGASVDGDLVAILFRFVDDWDLKQYLVKLKHADCTINNKQYGFLI